jgi:hypothetical protein
MYLIRGGAVTHYRRRRRHRWKPTERFYSILIGLLALIALFGFILLMRSLGLPERFTTSPYWQAVIGR